jgi:hypothetical protein
VVVQVVVLPPVGITVVEAVLVDLELGLACQLRQELNIR